jgi:hypothetical protein
MQHHYQNYEGEVPPPVEFPRWYHLLLPLTVPVAYVILLLSALGLLVADWLMLNTHHTELHVNPKPEVEAWITEIKRKREGK